MEVNLTCCTVMQLITGMQKLGAKRSKSRMRAQAMMEFAATAYNLSDDIYLS